MTVAEVHTLAGAYALDALSETEKAAFQRHLAGCEGCAREATELRATAARLADPVAVGPPPALRAAVLARISRTAQVGPAPRSAVAGPPRVRRWLAAAAAVVVVAGGAAGATFAVQEQRVRDARSHAAEADAIAAVLAAPDAQSHAVRAAGGGELTVVTSARLGQGVALLGSLAAPGDNGAYQLWTLHGARAVSAGVLAAGVRGGAQLLPDLTGVTGVAVSHEQAGGSTTGAPHLPVVASIIL
jgi:anti-sigma-K factor RskA